MAYSNLDDREDGLFYHSVLNTRLRLLYLLYDTVVMRRKTIKHAFSVFYTLIKHEFENGRGSTKPILKIRLEEEEPEFLFKHSYPRNRATFSHVPLLLEIYHWDNTKSRMPFTLLPGFRETFCKW